MGRKDEMFDANSTSLLLLLNQPNMGFKIPNYQRPYRWKTEEVEQLWGDIYGAFINNTSAEDTDKNYFLGSLITANKDGSPYSNIIDGQQRITTLTILFSVIARLMPEDIKFENDEDDDEETEIDNSISKTLVENCIYTENKCRLKFKPKSDLGASYRDVVKNNTLDEIKRYEISKKDLQKGEVKTLYYNTAKIFIEKLDELTKNDYNELKKFNKYLFNNVKMIHILCTDESFAIKMFQIINNRGLALYSSDLIKSSLCQRIEAESASDAAIQEFDDYWNNIEKEIENTDNMTIDDMFTIYLYSRKGENPKKSLDKEIIEYYSNIQPNEAIQDFNRFLKAYNTVMNTFKDKNIYALNYIPWQMYFKAIVATAELNNYADKFILFQELARFYYLNYISGKTLTQIKQTSFNIIKCLNKNEPIEKIKNEISNQLNGYNIIKLVKDSLSFENVYNTVWLKPLLLWIEYNEVDEIDFIPINKTVQIEHILPQSWKNNWKHFKEEDALKYVNSFGNLTLLSGTKNIKASNEAYSSKIEVYAGCGRETVCTKYRITQQIFDNYKNEWDVSTIEDRATYLLSKTEKILNIDLDDIKYKKQVASV